MHYFKIMVQTVRKHDLSTLGRKEERMIMEFRQAVFSWPINRTI